LLDKSYPKISARTADKVVSGRITVVLQENANVQKELGHLLVSQLSNRLTGKWCSNKTHQLDQWRTQKIFMGGVLIS